MTNLQRLRQHIEQPIAVAQSAAFGGMDDPQPMGCEHLHTVIGEILAAEVAVGHGDGQQHTT